jgi:D-tyrosyl-tRNA(Tyr) deacylase
VNAVDARESAVENVALRDCEPDLLWDGEAKVVDDPEVRRVGDSDEHLVLVEETDGQRLVAPRELRLEQACGDGLHLRPRQVDELELVLLRECFGESARRDPAAAEQDLAQTAAELCLLVQRRGQLLVRELARPDKKLAEARPVVGTLDGACGGTWAVAYRATREDAGGRGFHLPVIGDTRAGLRAVVQRVSRARVTPGGEIDAGLCILLGVAESDTTQDADRLAAKIARLRIFENDDGKFDRSLLDVEGGALVVSQFTLIADTAKGNRPSFSGAARPELAEPLYEEFCAALEREGVRVAHGVFGARMQVELVNDGPVTIVLDL